MNSFGTGGLFLCFVLTMLFLMIVFGWPAFVILVLLCIGYAVLLDGLNHGFGSDVIRSRRGKRRKRR